MSPRIDVDGKAGTVPNIKGWEIFIIIALVLLLFGAKRLPDAARGLGRSLRIFKAETKGLAGDASAETAEDDSPVAPAATPAPPPAIPAQSAPQPAADATPAAQPERTES